jgi:hypothetical protein
MGGFFGKGEGHGDFHPYALMLSFVLVIYVGFHFNGAFSLDG